MRPVERVLVIDDSESDRFLAIREIQKEYPEAEFQQIRDRAEFEAALSRGNFDVVVTDYELNWTNGVEIIKELKIRFPEIPVVMFTGSGNQEVAVEAMHMGASDYVVKSPTNYPRVRFAVKHAHERREQLTALQNSERLAVIGRLLASVAHEINNPLETISNLLYIMRRNPKSPEMPEWLQTVEEEFRRIEQISSRTLGFYRESPRPIPVNMSELMDEVLAVYSGRIHQQQVEIDRHYADGNAVAFPGEMRQVFSNLIANALDAMPHGGTIRVTVDPMLEEGNDWVRVTVCDTGTGIPEDALPNIFLPFFTTKGQNGTGLGLWVTYGIVKKYGGTIEAQNGSQGACFIVTMPKHVKLESHSSVVVEQNNGASRQ